MAKLAILGFGTVGSGVLEVVMQNESIITQRLCQPLKVGYICDIRDFSEHEHAELFVQDIAPILADDDVKVVVETIGGAGIALDFVSRALQAKKHVVTSNKELVASCGAQLLELAKQQGVCFLFEASVGGGMPLITPMHQCLQANNIQSLAGIVNGTTNFMLTRMEQDGVTFEAALSQAQKLGYAETIDPSYDVDGLDAGRKVAILASIACGEHIYPGNIHTRGIRGITPEDMGAAKAQGCAVKLIAYAQRQSGGEMCIGVEPMMVPMQNKLASVEDVFNAVLIDADMLGEAMFYGKGAGKLPTASAVVADVMDALRMGSEIHNTLFWRPAQPCEGKYATMGSCRVYVRVQTQQDFDKIMQMPNACALPNSLAAVLPEMSAQAIAQLCEQMGEGALILKFLG